MNSARNFWLSFSLQLELLHGGHCCLLAGVNWPSGLSLLLIMSWLLIASLSLQFRLLLGLLLVGIPLDIIPKFPVESLKVRNLVIPPEGMTAGGEGSVQLFFLRVSKLSL